MSEYTFYALVEGGYIDDIRAICPGDSALLREPFGNGRWVPVADLQEHPDVINFFGANVSKCCRDADPTVRR
jgi:hypothetical protein